MASGTAEANGVKIWYDRIGDPSDPCYLMITGAVGQAIAIDLGMCEMLAERGYQVIRFDQRDTGYSQKFAERTYDAGDVADDAIGLLDALGVSHAHVFGVSAGGAFAQLITMRHPKRVLSLVTFMSASVNPWEEKYRTPAGIRVREARERPMPQTEEGRVERIVETFRDYLSGPRYPVNEEFVRSYARLMMAREGRVGDSPRLVEALRAKWPFPAEDLAKIRCPVLVMHGTVDPLVNIKAAYTTVRGIPGARFIPIEGMGHDLTSPRAFPMIVDTLDQHARTAPPAWLRDGLDEPPAS